MKLIITFESSILEEFHDSIKIVSDGGFSIEVPLYAYPPQAGYISICYIYERLYAYYSYIYEVYAGMSIFVG